MSEARRSRTLFWIVLGLTLFQYVFLIADRRLPLGHETGTLYGIRFFFMTCAAQSGTPPLWMPYATQGTPSNWAWFEQGGLFQNALLLAAPLFRGQSFLPLFHLGMLMEELLFLVGVWLLASRHFRSPYTVFFVTVAAMGSCLWIDHATQNLGAIAALPLLLHLLHEFLEKKSRRSLFLAGSLAILQALGKPPALALFIPAAAGLYWVGYAVLFKFPLGDRLRELSWGRKEALIGASLLGIALMVGLGAFAGTGELVYAPGARWTWRGLFDGAGLGTPLQYLDFVLGLAPSLDTTVFCGYFTLAFALLALGGAGLRRSARLLGFLLGSLVVLSLLTLLLGVLLPIPFPSRPPAPGVPLVRLFAIFLAGFGFQGMLERQSVDSPRYKTVPILLLLGAVVLTALSYMLVLFGESMLGTQRGGDVLWPLTAGLPVEAISPLLRRMEVLPELVGTSGLMLGLAGSILFLRSSGRNRASLALALALAVHPFDTFGWKFRMTWLKSCPQPTTQAAAGPAFAARRSLDREPTQGRRERSHVLLGSLVSPYGRDSWLHDAFGSADLVDSPSIPLYCTASLERLAKALGDSDSLWSDRGFRFPRKSVSALKLSGVAQDKIQFFSDARFPGSADAIVKAISHVEYAGDILLVESPAGQSSLSPGGNDRISLGCEVIGFEADRLAASVDSPVGGAWLFYSDAWHPGWRATANGREVRIHRAGVAYKALQLPEGRLDVEFRFHSPLRVACAGGIALLSLSWIAWVLSNVFRLARRGAA